MLVQRNKNIVAKLLPDEVMMIDANNNNLFTLNKTGRIIWKYLWKPRTMNEIRTYMKSKFSCEKEITKDVEVFVKKAILMKIFSQITS